MKRIFLTTSLTALLISAPLAAERPQTTGLASSQQELAAAPIVKIDFLFSANDIIGETVRNGKGQELGSVEDLIVTSQERVVMAILSVGGVLGIGDKLVAVSYDKLHRAADGFVLFDISPDELEKMLAFSYGEGVVRTRARYMRSVERRFEKWSQRIEAYYAAGKANVKAGAKDTRDELQDALDRANSELEALKAASEDSWEKTKQSFEETMRDVSRAWNEVTS